MLFLIKHFICIFNDILLIYYFFVVWHPFFYWVLKFGDSVFIESGQRNTGEIPLKYIINNAD